jgi:hypothetical protein
MAERDHHRPELAFIGVIPNRRHRHFTGSLDDRRCHKVIDASALTAHWARFDRRWGGQG